MTVPTSDAPKQLMLLVSHEAGNCDSTVPKVDQSATEVRVTLVSRPRPLGSAAGTPLVLSGPSGATARHPVVPAADRCHSDDPYTAIVLGLDAPLGSRPLIDATTGEQIQVFASPVPDVGQVPAGYTGPQRQGTDPMSAATLDYRAGTLAPLALARYYRNDAGDRLTVVVAPSAHVIPGATVVDASHVDGHEATVTETVDTRCVTWATSPDRALQVCSDVRQPHGNEDAAGLLDEAELLAVARSLH